MGCCLSKSETNNGTNKSMKKHQVSNRNSSIKQPLLSKEDKAARQRRAEKRTKAVKELLETERTYCTSLKLCIDKYYKPLCAETKIINAEDIKCLFNDIETIHQLNHTFLSDLDAQCIDFDNAKTMIGPQFVKFCPYFRMYQNYCNSYDNAMVILNKYSEKQNFVNLTMQIRDECNGKTLQSLLILPIQRLPRYKLCLTEIIKNSEPQHPDLNNLQRALELVEETTQLINERMKEFEARSLVRSIESRFASTVKFVVPHRKFIKEGMLTKVDKTGKDRSYNFFLFNDMLCYASGKKENDLKLHQMLPIDGAFYICDIAHSEKYNDLAFELHSSVKSFIVHCDNYSTKKSWMKQLEQVIKEGTNKTLQHELSAPLMVPDDWSDECQMKDCETRFSFVNRRHHCRYCGKLICAKCGKYKLASKANKERVVKPVCKMCFNAYNKILPAMANAKEEEQRDDEDSNDSDG